MNSSQRNLSTEQQPSLQLLPDELQCHITSFLDKHSFFSLTATHSDYQALSLCRVEKTLLLAMRGEQKKLEEIITNNPEILTYAIDKIKDYSGRVFENITVFKYILWALDSPMWQGIITTVSNLENERDIKAKLASEYKEHQKNGVTYRFEGERYREKHFDFSPWIKALSAYIEKYNKQRFHNISDADLSRYWCEEVGGAQTKAVINVINEFCREDSTFYPLPDFKNKDLPRKFKISLMLDGDQTYKSCHWYSKQSEEKFEPPVHLGKNFAICRGNKKACALSLPKGTDLIDCQIDLQALTVLEKSRKEDYAEIEMLLKSNHQHLIEAPRQLQKV